MKYAPLYAFLLFTFVAQAKAEDANLCASLQLSKNQLLVWNDASDLETLQKLARDYQPVGRNDRITYYTDFSLTGQSDHRQYVPCAAGADEQILAELTGKVGAFLPGPRKPGLRDRVYRGRDVILHTGERVEVEPEEVNFRVLKKIIPASATDRLSGVSGQYDGATQTIQFVFGLTYELEVDTYETTIYVDNKSSKIYVASEFSEAADE